MGLSLKSGTHKADQGLMQQHRRVKKELLLQWENTSQELAANAFFLANVLFRAGNFFVPLPLQSPCGVEKRPAQDVPVPACALSPYLHFRFQGDTKPFENTGFAFFQEPHGVCKRAPAIIHQKVGMLL